jgi:16S rRNA (guanine527-N7)-methyltransferase
MDIILKYFPNLSAHQQQQLAQLLPLYIDWNQKINVISRKDIENFYERHVLHSLAIAKYIQFVAGTKVLDLGCGGGFPAVPLAIFFPEVQVFAVDSIGKKIKVVEEVSKSIGLTNITAMHARAESLNQNFDFIVTRAVAPMWDLYRWVSGKIEKEHKNPLNNGIIALKGGDLSEEFAKFRHRHKFIALSDYFAEEYFETKKIVYVPCL